jgi:hypothetical protein
MASTLLNNAIVALKNETVDALVAFLIEKEVMSEELSSVITEYKQTLGTVEVLKKGRKGKEDKPKKTRAPTEYNKWLSKKMEELKEEGFKGKELMAEAMKRWKTEGKAEVEAKKNADGEKPEESVVESNDETTETKESEIKPEPTPEPVEKKPKKATKGGKKAAVKPKTPTPPPSDDEKYDVLGEDYSDYE